jgi:hypothetical protein
MMRADWRTCKKEESELISNYNDYLIDKVKLDEDMVPEVEEWSLYGKIWALNTGECLYAQYPIEPLPMEDYVQWYLLRLQWLHIKN